MQISVNRIHNDIVMIAGFSETPGEGATRPTFSTAWRQARDYVIGQAELHGCHTRIDGAGNVHIRQRRLSFDARAWLCGSHVDSVPHGGDYDGVAGVVLPLEILRAAFECERPVPMELVIFAEEEGPTFGLGMLGSRAWVGELSADELSKLFNQQGESYLQAGHPHGVRPDRVEDDVLQPTGVIGFIEAHIEQGPGMWRRDQRLAVVRAIAGRRQYRCTVVGEANHAGATAMSDRRDALVGAGEMVVGLESLAKQTGQGAVMTVGRLVSLPNAVNVVPDRVEFTIDFRAGDNDTLDATHPLIDALIRSVARRRSLGAELVQTEHAPAREMDAALVKRVSEAAAREGVFDVPVTVSGALHDSAILSPHVPTVMLFVPSRDGISHNPAEFSRVEDIAVAARVVARVVGGTA